MTQSTIKEITRLKTSKNGNPRFHIIMEDGTEGATKADAGWAYSIDPWGWKGKKVNYDWKIYKSVYRVFDSIEEAQEMTRQHYEFLTDEVLPFMASPSSIEEVADKLGDTNPLFNRGVFMARALEKWEQKNIPQAMIEEVTS